VTFGDTSDRERLDAPTLEVQRLDIEDLEKGGED
jgi:hypothetical protein